MNHPLARPGYFWAFNYLTGERREIRDGTSVPDGFSVRPMMMMMDSTQSFPKETHVSYGYTEESTITKRDRDPVVRQTVRQVLGDAEYARMEADKTNSPIRWAISAFWGRDASRTEAQELALFDAIKPLLATGILNMVNSSHQDAVVVDRRNGGKGWDAYDESFAIRSGAYDDMKQRVADAWKNPR